MWGVLHGAASGLTRSHLLYTIPQLFTSSSHNTQTVYRRAADTKYLFRWALSDLFTIKQQPKSHISSPASLDTA